VEGVDDRGWTEPERTSQGAEWVDRDHVVFIISHDILQHIGSLAMSTPLPSHGHKSIGWSSNLVDASKLD
jgi:hypothetical protein